MWPYQKPKLKTTTRDQEDQTGGTIDGFVNKRKTVTTLLVDPARCGAMDVHRGSSIEPGCTGDLYRPLDNEPRLSNFSWAMVWSHPGLDPNAKGPSIFRIDLSKISPINPENLLAGHRTRIMAATTVAARC